MFSRVFQFLATVKYCTFLVFTQTEKCIVFLIIFGSLWLTVIRLPVNYPKSPATIPGSDD